MDPEEEDGSHIPLTYDIVTSEIHAVRKPEKINGELGAVLSRFELCYPPNFTARNGASGNCPTREASGVQVDEDGDLVVPRKKGTRNQEVVLIEHQQSTSLSLVGEQVWRGALFLADFLLHSASVGQTNNPNLSSSLNCQSPSNTTPVCNGSNAESPSSNGPVTTTDSTELQYNVPTEEVSHHLVDVTGKRVLEVASGVGLTSIVAALVAESVLVTDINRGSILRLIERNLEHNKALIDGCKVTVGELDFCNLDTIDNLVRSGRLRDVDVILAADVVYNNDLTDAFFDAAHRLLSEPPNKTLLVALEKRYVFTTTEYDVVAPCYDYFLHCLDRLKSETKLHPRASQLRVDRHFGPENVSALSLMSGTNEGSTPTACAPLSMPEKSVHEACNGSCSFTPFDSEKVFRPESTPCSVNAVQTRSEASHSGSKIDHCTSQSYAANNMDSTIRQYKPPNTANHFNYQLSTNSEGNAQESNDNETMFQRIKFSLKRLHYDNFPQYFAYDRTKELVLWKIEAEIS